MSDPCTGSDMVTVYLNRNKLVVTVIFELSV